MTVQYLVGDSRAVTATLPDGSIDLIASSPPFLALRSYLPAGHEAKGAEIGSEANPAAFIDTLLELTAEWGRVLASHGSIAIELGDTYSGDDRRNGETVDIKTPHRHEVGRPGSGRANTGSGWPRAKSLALIPQLYAVALAYGINPLTGQPSPAGRWLVRNVIVWHRPNPAVGALGDKVRPSTSYIVVATRSAKRWFDLTAVRTPYLHPNHPQVGKPTSYHPGMAGEGYGDEGQGTGRIRTQDPAGAPPLDAWFDSEPADAGPFDPYDGTHDLWTLTTQPSSLAHYAMWPAKLAERLILMMCPREVCTVCGEPRRRMEGATYIPHGDPIRQHAEARVLAMAADKGIHGTAQSMVNGRATKVPHTLGWTDCGHDNYRPGLTLDPFGGTGTTGAVADLHGRDAVLIDLDPRNHDLYPRRYDEVKRALFGTPAPMPGQMELAL